MLCHFTFVIPILILASSAAGHSSHDTTQLVTKKISEGQKAQANRRHQEQDKEACFICSRIGTELLPEHLPYSYDYDLTCGYLQERIIGKLSGDSRECNAGIDLFEERCCQHKHQLQNYECVTNIRSSILNGSYDKNVAPVQAIDSMLHPVEVDTLIMFFAVKELDVLSNTLEIFVNVELTWNDSRLRWDHNSTTNCATRIYARADHSVEETEIWVPALDLVNRASSIQDFPSSKATVKSDGTVRWSRLGSLRAICAFIGLRRMPFDDLGCRLVFHDDDGLNTIDYLLRETSNNRTKGFTYWDIMDVAYSEFTIVNEKSETSYSTTSPGVFYIDLYFKRARRHYVMFILLPNILFTFISFGQFVFEIDSSDRMAFSITVVLIIVTQSVLTATLLPVCNELLWLNAFNLVSMLFTLVGILESLTVYLIHRLILSKRVREGKDKAQKRDENKEEYVNLLSSRQLNDDLSEDSAQFSTKIEEGKEDEDSITFDQKKEITPDQPCSSLTAALAEATHTPQNLRSSSVGQEEDLSSSSEQKRTTRIRTQKSVILRALTTTPDGLEGWVERIDILCFVMFPLVYSIFTVAMFVRNPLWEDDKAERWSNLT